MVDNYSVVRKTTETTTTLKTTDCKRHSGDKEMFSSSAIHLWGLERVFRRKGNVKKVHARSVGRSTRSHNRGYPLVQVVALGSCTAIGDERGQGEVTKKEERERERERESHKTIGDLRIVGMKSKQILTCSCMVGQG